MSRREMASVRERLTNDGYREGLDVGIDRSLQEGFDKGYSESMNAAWPLGLLLGAAEATFAARRRQRAAVSADAVTDPASAPHSAAEKAPTSHDAALEATARRLRLHVVGKGAGRGEGGGGGDDDASPGAVNVAITAQEVREALQACGADAILAALTIPRRDGADGSGDGEEKLDRCEAPP
ncbi:unnamed protein product [Phaeothamnion confervicola]